MATKAIQTVFIVDDNSEIRRLLTFHLRERGLQIEAFESALAFIEYYRPTMAGCLILDLAMPEMSGIQLQEYMSAKGLRLPIIVLSGRAVVSDAVKSMKLGTFEFLEKPFDVEVLIAKVQAALDKDQALRLADENKKTMCDRYAKLSTRERRVMSLVISGLPSKEIAGRMGLAVSTVDNHRARILKKLKATTSAHLSRIALVVDPTLGFTED